ncbi:MAG: tRNA (adenosine(37)-N6)-threonylcarbamoyltransferase complex dimerization subunit type 1 TsaB [Rhodobacterales bacterium]|nr:MAG: tRNA (adenosine(37)-N6)-threonylcarbamoyltransferase complex dimerization subunit type 1 TsaB [Rhodobacterales bacterium]
MSCKPLILAFDTSVAHIAAAVLAGDQIVAENTLEMAKGQAERLFDVLEELLQQAGITWSDLNAIGVGIGPGNFTGIRISVSAARGLALALGVPAVGVSAFQAQAIDASGPVVSAVPAHRGMVYVQTLTDQGEGKPELIRLGDLPAYSAGQQLIGPDQPLSAAAIARIAAQRFETPDLPRPAPLYVRAPDAAPPRDPAPVILHDS